MPLPVISIAQMREWEKATWASGQTEIEVIRRVGLAVARLGLRLTAPGDLILILAGKGNNGEDARCAKNHLHGRRVDVLDVAEPRAGLARLEALLSLRPALVIDGLFGIGLNRGLSADWITCIERINLADCRVLAVDVPSGLDADSGEPEGAAVRAAVTLTVGAPKKGLVQESAWPYVGRLEVASEVGLVACPYAQAGELRWICPQDFSGFPPARRVATHKGSYGHLAILAGSLGYHGAAVLAARAAQRAQPGLITLYTMESVYGIAASHLQAVMVHPYSPKTRLPGSFDALLIGPGLAAPENPEELKRVARDLWRDAEVPVIVDASALEWLPSGPIKAQALRVITPHPGEAGRLLGITAAQVQSNRVKALRALSEKHGNCWVILKGHGTLTGRVTGELYINCSGNPHMAQGGSGDVLSGYMSGLLAQPRLQQDCLKTLGYAVWQHGATGDTLQETSRNWVVEELVEAMGSATVTDPGASPS